jgi:hypothetical protein
MQTLDDAQLRQLAPSIFSTAPRSDVSDRYGFASTIDIVEVLRAQDWHPVRAGQTFVKHQHNIGYAKHMLRFRKGSGINEVGDCIAELVLNNSHDKSSSLSIRLGLFRLVCSNGLITPIGEMGGIRVRHGKRIVPAVLSKLPRLVNELPALGDQVDSFRAIGMSSAQRQDFAAQALALRYGPQWRMRSIIAPDQLLKCRRYDDDKDNLWTTYNVVQENLMRGGLRGFSRTGRRVRTRPIRSVNADLDLNIGLWRLTEKHAQHRLAA